MNFFLSLGNGGRTSMKCLGNSTYTHAQTEKLIDAGTLIYVNMVIVHRLISILCFFGHSHSSIDNSYELFICCTCYDNLYTKIENSGPATARIGIKGHAPLS